VFGLDSSKICTHVRRCMSAWLGKRTRKRIRLGGGGNNPGKHKPAGGGGGEGGSGWVDGRGVGSKQLEKRRRSTTKGNNNKKMTGGIKARGKAHRIFPPTRRSAVFHYQGQQKN